MYHILTAVCRKYTCIYLNRFSRTSLHCCVRTCLYLPPQKEESSVEEPTGDVRGDDANNAGTAETELVEQKSNSDMDTSQLDPDTEMAIVDALLAAEVGASSAFFVQYLVLVMNIFIIHL